jgi:hypothetical protein
VFSIAFCKSPRSPKPIPQFSTPARIIFCPSFFNSRCSSSNNLKPKSAW